MIGSSELVVILVIALLLFGPKKLPELAKSLGKAVTEYNKAARDFERETRAAKDQVLEEISSKRIDSARVVEIAKNLGISTENKLDPELLKEIAAKTRGKSK